MRGGRRYSLVRIHRDEQSERRWGGSADYPRSRSYLRTDEVGSMLRALLTFALLKTILAHFGPFALPAKPTWREL
jgi:hypothetical protein